MPAQDAAGVVAQLWTPYCGVAPAPAELASRWNLDPWLLAVLALCAAAYLALRRTGEARDLLIGGAAVALIVAFVSPLCALSSALFSARVAHHAVLIVVVAPLVAFGLPQVRRGPGLATATLAHAMLLWLWHAPGPYAWALTYDAGYWLMQASLLGSAVAFWAAVRRASGLAAAGALLATMMQMGLLGALIAFAPSPLYAPHLATTWAWGLTPLADQQLAGVIMWAPMAMAYLLAALVLVGRSLTPAQAEAT